MNRTDPIWETITQSYFFSFLFPSFLFSPIVFVAFLIIFSSCCYIIRRLSCLLSLFCFAVFVRCATSNFQRQQTIANSFWRCNSIEKEVGIYAMMKFEVWFLMYSFAGDSLSRRSYTQIHLICIYLFIYFHVVVVVCRLPPRRKSTIPEAHYRSQPPPHTYTYLTANRKDKLFFFFLSLFFLFFLK